MKLTHLQETFVQSLLDLYGELNGPIHYSVLANRIGVSPFTAYGLLRLLEKKGLVISQYRLDSDKLVVGRSVASDYRVEGHGYPLGSNAAGRFYARITGE